jgi:hypothetical protein
MRLGALVSVLVLSLVSGAAFAAEPAPPQPFVSRDDQFAINFPAPPKVEEFTYISEYKSPWKAHRYTSEYMGFRYVMTVVDMSTTALTQDRDQYRNVGRAGNERRGSMAYAASQLRPTGKVTVDAYDELQVIPGHKLDITLPDGRTNIVEIHIHDKRLYILEIFSPPGEVPGYDVQTSLQILDKNGNVPRYRDMDYSFPDYMQVQSALPLGQEQAAPPGWTGAEAQPQTQQGAAPRRP